MSNNTVFKKTVRLSNHIITEAVVPSDLIVLFHQLKIESDFIIEKCVELGVKTIIPIISIILIYTILIKK